MRTNTLALVLLFGVSAAPGRVNAQTSSNSSSAAPSSSAADPNAAANNSLDRLFPIARLDEILPSWLRIGGQYRNRLEGPTGIGYASTSDFYLLDRLRVWVTIQPKPWLRFHGEVQDSRIFFNHHIPNANPYQDSWTKIYRQ